MKLDFYKFHGTGNDFIMIDNRHHNFPKNDTILVERLCHRRFGIGADGLILLENGGNGVDFSMVYFNSDGRTSSMCGNGGRCIVAFAQHLNLIKNEAVFSAIDGVYHAKTGNGIVSLKMQNLPHVELTEEEIFLNTGSPHKVIFGEEVEKIEVKQEGAKIRYSEKYKLIGGTNVNFVEQTGADSFKVRTYERGVEDETFSCGTGVTAVAIAANMLGMTPETSIILQTPGGELKVSFEKLSDGFKNIWLTGPAKFVFKGEVEC